jgi:hypothetical protein
MNLELHLRYVQLTNLELHLRYGSCMALRPLAELYVWFGVMVFNTTFNNISVISRRSVLMVKDTAGTGENH